MTPGRSHAPLQRSLKSPTNPFFISEVSEQTPSVARPRRRMRSTAGTAPAHWYPQEHGRVTTATQDHFNLATGEQTQAHRQRGCQTELLTKFTFSGESRHPTSAIRNSLEHAYAPARSGIAPPPTAAGTAAGCSPRPVPHRSGACAGNRRPSAETPCLHGTARHGSSGTRAQMAWGA